MNRHFVFVTAESIKFVNENIIPSLFIAVFEHLLESLALIVCTRHGSVYISIENENIVSFGIVLTDVELSFNRLFCLQVA